MFDADTPSKRKRGRPAGKQKVNSTVQDPQTAADPKDGQAAQPNNLVGAERNQPTGHKKRGRPRGSVNKKKTVAAEAHLAAEVEADRAAAAANGQEAKVDVEVAEADVVGSHARLPKLNDKDETEAGVARDVVTDAVAGPSTDSMADGVADSRAQDRLESSEARAEGKLASSGALAEGMLESPDVMARKASTGDGSRLVRPTRDTECDTVDSLLEAPGAGQSALSPNGQHRGQQQGEQAEESSEPAQNGVGQGEQGNPGAPKPNAAGLDTADRPRHRLSRVTGMYIDAHYMSCLVNLMSGRRYHISSCISDRPLHKCHQLQC